MKNLTESEEIEVGKAKEGITDLEFQYREHRQKMLELDTKITDIFILSTSIILIYLSTTFKELNFPFLVAVFSFALVILISIVSMWKLRELHQKISTTVSQAKEGFKDVIHKLDNEPDYHNYEAGKESDRVILGLNFKKLHFTRKIFLTLQYSSLLLFVNGLFFTLSIQTWWDTTSEFLKIKIVAVIWFLLVFLFSRFVYKNLYKYFRNSTNKSSPKTKESNENE